MSKKRERKPKEKPLRVMVPFEGGMSEAEEVSFSPEGFKAIHPLKLSDGATINLICTVNRIYRICGRETAEGLSMYLINGNVRMKPVKVPESK